MNLQVRSGLLHAAGVGAGAVAGISFAASHSVDLYAAYDQLNIVIADITKLVGMVMPLATGAYAVYLRSSKKSMTDTLSDPKAVEAAKEIPPTAQVVAVADALKKQP